VALDAEQLAQNPLRVGLSMEATVDVTDQSGKSLADAPRAASVTQTDVYTVLDQQANDEVRKVIAANLGRGAKTNVHAAAKAGQGV
jgi:membrane fusion protein (multidrug efflux system)